MLVSVETGSSAPQSLLLRHNGGVDFHPINSLSPLFEKNPFARPMTDIRKISSLMSIVIFNFKKNMIYFAKCGKGKNILSPAWPPPLRFSFPKLEWAPSPFCWNNLNVFRPHISKWTGCRFSRKTIFKVWRSWGRLGEQSARSSNGKHLRHSARGVVSLPRLCFSCNLVFCSQRNKIN